jgi:hypothetical protein
MTHHKLAVTREGRSWQALCQRVSYHVVRAKRDKLDETSKDEFTDVVPTNVNVSGVLSADWINRHSHSREIIFVKVSRSHLSKAKIVKDSPDIHDLFSTFVSGHVFSLGS